MSTAVVSGCHWQPEGKRLEVAFAGGGRNADLDFPARVEEGLSASGSKIDDLNALVRERLRFGRGA